MTDRRRRQVAAGIAERLAKGLDDWAHDDELREHLDLLEAAAGDVAPLALEGVVEAIDVLTGVLERARRRVKVLIQAAKAP